MKVFLKPSTHQSDNQIGGFGPQKGNVDITFAFGKWEYHFSSIEWSDLVEEMSISIMRSLLLSEPQEIWVEGGRICGLSFDGDEFIFKFQNSKVYRVSISDVMVSLREIVKYYPFVDIKVLPRE
ncbi:hypothetical protein E5163_10175 [Marinicauda algicola]|uniref:Uncharacterized protein n=1 Tax=Marinicauda algicola TaxID=2029849 RepID=A0A4S2GY85_9PROT|nr:hypothetical protein [Marinicauda algicola]TGY88190.1 hypothetical protein E5163_10175 [Marinicauda algicola]